MSKNYEKVGNKVVEVFEKSQDQVRIEKLDKFMASLDADNQLEVEKRATELAKNNYGKYWYLVSSKRKARYEILESIMDIRGIK